MQWDSDEEREFIEDEMRDLDLQMKEDGEDLLERIETDNDYLKVQQEEDDERFETEVEHYNIQAEEDRDIWENQMDDLYGDSWRIADAKRKQELADKGSKEPSRIKVLGSEDKVVAKLRSYQKKAENKTANLLGK
jgi:hypothetical protein